MIAIIYGSSPQLCDDTCYQYIEEFVTIASEYKERDLLIAMAIEESKVQVDFKKPICGPLQIHSRYVEESCKELNDFRTAIDRALQLKEYFKKVCRKERFSKNYWLSCYNEGLSPTKRGVWYRERVNSYQRRIINGSNRKVRDPRRGAKGNEVQ